MKCDCSLRLRCFVLAYVENMGTWLWAQSVCVLDMCLPPPLRITILLCVLGLQLDLCGPSCACRAQKHRLLQPFGLCRRPAAAVPYLSLRARCITMGAKRKREADVECQGLCDKECVCAKSCKWCRLSLGSPSPLDPSKRLPNTRGKGLEDDICRNTLNWKYRGVVRTELERDIKERRGYNKFMDDREEWISNQISRLQMDGDVDAGDGSSKKRRMTKDMCQGKVKSVAQRSNSTILKVPVLHIWPPEIWSTYFGEPAPQRRIKGHTIGGSTVSGIGEKTIERLDPWRISG